MPNMTTEMELQVSFVLVKQLKSMKAHIEFHLAKDLYRF